MLECFPLFPSLKKMWVDDTNIDAGFNIRPVTTILPSTRSIQASSYPLFGFSFTMETNVFIRSYMNIIHKYWKALCNCFPRTYSPKMIILPETGPISTQHIIGQCNDALPFIAL